MKKGKSLCIFSTKGGVGKTTTAINIAGILSREKKKTLLIDLDNTSGAIATYLRKIPTKTIASCEQDYIAHSFDKIEDYVTKYDDCLDILATCKDPRVGSKLDFNIIPLIIERSKYNYDYLIIDMNHGINEFNLTILDNTDLCLLVMSNDLIDIKNTANLVTIFKDAGKTNYKIMLNNSVHPNKKYYSLFDIKNAIKANIDYTIDSSFHIDTIDKYIYEGKILTLDPKMPKVYPMVEKVFNSLIDDLSEVEDEK